MSKIEREQVVRKTIVEVLRGHAETKGGDLLYTFIDMPSNVKNTLTYSELLTQSELLAKQLLSNYAKGDRALLLFDQSSEFIVAFVACLISGIIAVPAYPPRRNRSLARLNRLAQNAEPALVITTHKIREIIDDDREKTFCSDADVIIPGNLELNFSQSGLPDISPDDIAFIQYSSGSTGAPKGVVVTHANIMSNQNRIQACFGTSPNSSTASWLPYFHDMGLSGSILQPLFTGFPSYLMAPNWFLQKPSRWLRAISDYRIDITGGPNFAWKMCAEKIKDDELEDIDLSCLRVAFNGAEPIDAHTLDIFSKRFSPIGFNRESFLPCYGMAEATLFISGKNSRKGYTYIDVDNKKLSENVIVSASLGTKFQRLISSGGTYLNDELMVVHPETLQVLPDRNVGEIWFRSPSVTSGYWRDPSLTALTFNSSPVGIDENSWLRTGDLGFLAEGDLFVTGRLKDLIIIRGRNFYPQDIEETVTNSYKEFVENGAAAFSVSDDDQDGLVVVQEVKRTAVKSIDASAAIREVLRAVAIDLELPLHDLVLIKPASLAKTSSGKIRRSANRQRYINSDFEVIASLKNLIREQESPPVDRLPYEADALSISVDNQQLSDWIRQNIAWATGRQAEQIDIDENFIALGLDSALSVTFISALSNFCGRELPATLPYDFPSIRQLVNHLEGGETLSRSSMRTANECTEKDVAIIGQSCRFPGADNPDEFWKGVVEGECQISPYPKARAYGAEVESAFYRGGFLEDIDLFDHDYFSITAKEGRFIDPQHRLMLELADEAIRDAGYLPSSLSGSEIGVYIGIGQYDYVLLSFTSEERNNAYAATGVSMNMAPNRVSYFYNFTGPSLAIDTACSSAMVALHNAVRSIRMGECCAALVGGVKLIMFSQSNTILRNAQMLSPDGLCKSFDKDANGYVRGEGGGMMLLKPLAAAKADGDNILAVIKGTATNQDGKSNGITAPNGEAQKKVIAAALRDAEVSPQEVSFIEAHGTGTALGDPIEVNALAATYGRGRSKSNPLLITSVKANIGHLEPAAGIAGLIKAVQCLRYQRIPKQILFSNPNPHIDWDALSISVPTESHSLNSPDRLLAGVSSFGFGGSNAHTVIQQAPTELPNNVVENINQNPAILAISSRRAQAMDSLLLSYAAHIEKFKQIPIQQLCWRLNQGQENAQHRISVVADDHQQLLRKLRGHKWKPGPIEATGLVFMYSGQGSQYNSMALGLISSQPVFKSAMSRCAALLDQELDTPIFDVIFSKNPDCELINQTGYTQPAIFCVQYALTQLWLSIGLRPNVVMGHSVGEFAAACLAGVMTLEDAAKLIAARARLIQNLPSGGGMLAVKAPWSQVRPYIREVEDMVSLAAINGPEAVVISGDIQALELVRRALSNGGLSATSLSVSHAFHSHLMKPVVEDFRALVRAVTLTKPSIRFISTLTGKEESDRVADPEYWVEHILQPVLFNSAAEVLTKEKSTFLEIGPGQTLCRLIKPLLASSEPTAISSFSKQTADNLAFVQALSKLYAAGFAVDWAKVLPCPASPRIPLPAFPYLRKRLWLSVNPNLDGEKVSHPAAVIDQELISEHLYNVQWREQDIVNGFETSPQNWLIFVSTPDDALLQSFERQISAEGHKCVVVEMGENYNALDGRYVFPIQEVEHWRSLLTRLAETGGAPDVVMHLTTSSALSGDTLLAVGNAATLDYLACLAFVKASVSLQNDGIISHLPRMGIVTRDAIHPGMPATSMGFVHQQLLGLSKVITLEYPEFRCINIDLSGFEGCGEAALKVYKEITVETDERQVFISPRTRAIARLSKVGSEFVSRRKPKLRPDRTYLVTGALGALGMETARWMIERGARTVALLARRAPSESDRNEINRLEQLGAMVMLLRADVANREELQSALKTVERKGNLLGGIVHCAGALNDKSIPNQTADSYEMVAAPKVDGAWNLHSLTQDKGLEFFVMLSSAASLFGSKGQANYAAANAFLDGLACHRSARGLPALSLQLGAIERIGMASASNPAKPTASGVRPLRPSEYLEALEKLLYSSLFCAAAVPIDWDIWQGLAQKWAFLEDFSSAGNEQGRSHKKTVSLNPDLPQEIICAKQENRTALITEYLQERIASVIETSVEEIDAKVPLTALGLDSLMVVEIQSKIRGDFLVHLSIATLFEAGSLEVLASELATELADLDRTANERSLEGMDSNEIFEEGVL